MNFSLSEDQILIRDSAESFLATASHSAQVRAAMQTAQGFDPALWQRLSGDLGWCATTIPEQHGGLGLGPVELTLLLEQTGRRLVCAPFFASAALATTALLAGASPAAQAHWLPQLADGRLQATLGANAHGVGLTGKLGLRAQAQGGGWVLHGSLEQVPDGASATLRLVLAELVDGAAAARIGLFAVDGSHPALQVQGLETWDATRRVARWQFDGVHLPSTARLDREGLTTTDLLHLEARAALLLAAEQLGGAQHCLDLSVAYLAERTQFGQKLANFQALKHRCAEMMVAVESTRSLVYGAAALAASEADPTAQTLEAGAAKALASDSFFFCAQEAIQLHGGVGFTWEYDPQLYFKRAQASSQWLGHADLWRERIACALLD